MQKKGVWRFFEVLARDFWGLVRLNLLFCACSFVSVALFVLGLLGFFAGFVFVLSLVAAFPVGGAYCACLFCVSKMLRDDPGYIWYDFKRKFLENWKAAMAPGVLCAAFVYAQVFLWVSLAFGGLEIDAALVVLGFVSLLVFGMVSPFFFLQVTYIDLGVSQILKNSVLISFSNIGRSFLGAFFGGFLWVAFVLFLPGSLGFLPLVVLIGFSLSWLLNLMWVWAPVDKLFGIDAALR